MSQPNNGTVFFQGTCLIFEVLVIALRKMIDDLIKLKHSVQKESQPSKKYFTEKGMCVGPYVLKRKKTHFYLSQIMAK